MFISIQSYYIITINIFTLMLFGIDKLKAQKHWWRISEITLFIFAGIGGSIGAICGMYMFHHKTMHKKFFIGMPVIIILQLFLLIYLTTRI